MTRTGYGGRGLVLGFLAVLLSACLAPDNGTLMELNRQGYWAAAERIGKDRIAHPGALSHSDLSETYFHVVYALTRQKKAAEARRLMADFEDFRSLEPLEPSLLWLGRETARLKDELGLLAGAAKRLYLAMEKNLAGDYAGAREDCAAVLADPGARPGELATARFVAAVSSVRLGELARAEGEYLSFLALKSALPPGHQALLEEEGLRSGLERLRAEAAAK